MEKEKMLAELEKLKAFRGIIIVEGKKDITALARLGIRNTRSIKEPLFELCEKISSRYSEAVILTDLDSEGKKLYSKIREGLEKNGISIDDSFREFLFRETELRQIEGIDSYIDNIS